MLYMYGVALILYLWHAFIYTYVHVLLLMWNAYEVVYMMYIILFDVGY